jgi:hypothetical protein
MSRLPVFAIGLGFSFLLPLSAATAVPIQAVSGASTSVRIPVGVPDRVAGPRRPSVITSSGEGSAVNMELSTDLGRPVPGLSNAQTVKE